jgi:tight adherence protein B
MAMLGFLLAVAAASLGLLAVVRLSRGMTALPSIQLRSSLHRRSTRQLGVALVAGLVALLITRWALAGVAATAIVVLWPRLFGGGRAGRRQLEKIEALAAWTESLRDTANGRGRTGAGDSGNRRRRPRIAASTGSRSRCPARRAGAAA